MKIRSFNKFFLYFFFIIIVFPNSIYGNTEFYNDEINNENIYRIFRYPPKISFFSYQDDSAIYIDIAFDKREKFFCDPIFISYSVYGCDGQPIFANDFIRLQDDFHLVYFRPCGFAINKQFLDKTKYRVYLEIFQLQYKKRTTDESFAFPYAFVVNISSFFNNQHQYPTVKHCDLFPNFYRILNNYDKLSKENDKLYYQYHVKRILIIIQTFIKDYWIGIIEIQIFVLLIIYLLYLLRKYKKKN